MAIEDEDRIRLQDEFERLAIELRQIRFPDEDELRPGERELLDPKYCAVMVIDVHGAYCDPSETLPTLMQSGTDRLQAVVPELSKFLDTARESGTLVVWTKMKENPDDMPDNYKAKLKIDGTPPLSVPGTKGYEYSGISPKEGDLEIEKTTYEALISTRLYKEFQRKGIRTVILAGGYTSRCVATTAAVAADVLGMNVFITRDLIGVPDKITSEELTTLNVIHDIFGFVKTPGVIEEAWKSYTPASKE